MFNSALDGLITVYVGNLCQPTIWQKTHVNANAIKNNSKEI